MPYKFKTRARKLGPGLASPQAQTAFALKTKSPRINFGTLSDTCLNKIVIVQKKYEEHSTPFSIQFLVSEINWKARILVLMIELEPGNREIKEAVTGLIRSGGVA